MASQCLSHQSIESPRRSYLCKARRVQCRERGNDWVHSFTPAQTHAFPTQSDLEYELAKDSLSSCNKACKVMLCYVGTPCCVHLFTDKAPQFGQAAFANNLKAWISIKSTDLFCILHFAWLFYGTKRQPFLNANRSIGVPYHTDSYGVSVYFLALALNSVAPGHWVISLHCDVVCALQPLASPWWRRDTSLWDSLSTLQCKVPKIERKSRLSQCNSPAMTKP